MKVRKSQTNPVVVYVASDHGGWHLKRKLVPWLRQRGVVVRDVGPERHLANDDYPIWAARLARLVQRHPSYRGIVICRSGVGMAIAANKFAGIRAVQGWSVTVVQQSRQDENTNVLSLAADYHEWRMLIRIVSGWLNTPFRPLKRYQRRLRQLARLEHAG